MISDALLGLTDPTAAVFARASWQRCRKHFMTSLLTRVGGGSSPGGLTRRMRTVYQQPSPGESHVEPARVVDRPSDRLADVAPVLDESGVDVPVWSANPREWLTREIRRQTDVAGIFPSRSAVLRVIDAVPAERRDERSVVAG